MTQSKSSRKAAVKSESKQKEQKVAETTPSSASVESAKPGELLPEVSHFLWNLHKHEHDLDLSLPFKDAMGGKSSPPIVGVVGAGLAHRASLTRSFLVLFSPFC